MISIWRRDSGVWWNDDPLQCIVFEWSWSQWNSGGLCSSSLITQKYCEDLIDGRGVPAKKNDGLLALPSSAPPPPPRLATVQPSISRGDQLQIQIPIATCHNIFLYSANMHPVLSHSFAAAHERTDGRQLDFLYHGGEKDSNRIESVSLHLRCCSQAGRNLYSSLALFFLSAVERPTRSAMSGDWMASNRVQQQ